MNDMDSQTTASMNQQAFNLCQTREQLGMLQNKQNKTIFASEPSQDSDLTDSQEDLGTET